MLLNHSYPSAATRQDIYEHRFGADARRGKGMQ